MSDKNKVMKKNTNPWFEAWRRLLQSKIGIAGLGIIVFLIVVAALAPVLAPYDPIKTDILARYRAPSSEHLLGTDGLGRDILSRIIYGSRISLQVGLLSVALALVFGVSFGLIAGFYGGKLDMAIMRFMDIMLAFPSILLAIGIVAILGPQLKNAMIAIGIINVPRFARIVRSSVLSIKESEYISAARALGAGDLRIIFKHLLPNAMAPLIVQTTLSIATAILEAAALSFLGLGAQPPSPEWGAMLSDARSSLQKAPWVATFPGLAIIFGVLGFNLLGDGLRDALDPKMKNV
ncbi:peptide/nickel transport system permease protein [Halanaerobium saccharolyticum]|uniref:Peptide/nickel transport system permease protein n=1 Tax=Halanaerobium saccharolyticum TaxID=43595 RepID=A0A4R6LND5_9FIRM|nr:nickel transporter permease [Halanaerobium saccharolyticum]TDO87807.1 peptide/nickel transport system permease protein [Halanaerobium saccharolyticum]